MALRNLIAKLADSVADITDAESKDSIIFVPGGMGFLCYEYKESLASWVPMDIEFSAQPHIDGTLPNRLIFPSAFVSLAYLNSQIGISLQAHSAALDTFSTNGSAFYLSRANHTGTQTAGTITGLATVATSGSYTDLANKPTLGTAAAQPTSAFDAAGAAATAQAFAIQRTNHTGTQAQSTVVNLVTDLAAKETSITAGTTLQYWRGDKTWQTFPTNLSSFTNGPGYTTNTGTVISIVAGTGLSGGTITSSGTISMPNTGTAGTYSGVTTDVQGRVTAGTNRSFNNTPARALVSVAAAANGILISATRDAFVSYSTTINTSSTLAGGAAGYVVLEICATNSAVAANWIEISRTADGQANGLIVGLTLTQVGGGCITGMVPAGYYSRQRTANTTGTPTYVANGQQEVLL